MIIAEIGLNHKGSETDALVMLQDLLKTGVDAVTFQIRESPYYDETKPHKKKLSKEFYKKAIRLAKSCNKKIGFSIADESLVGYLNKSWGGVDFWKTLSWDILNYDLQNLLQKTNKIVFISTGVSGMDEIIIASKKFKNIKFIHTQLTYDINEVNLNAIRTIREATKVDVAFGLHCSNKNVLYVCLGYEPSDIFFYVKGNSKKTYPDDKHAIVLTEVDDVVQEIRLLQTAVGTGKKEKMEKKL